jgi:two-component system, chemotaxis family, protein-glutamate methylesterase/glutaminase
MLNAEGVKRDVIVFGASAGGVHALIQLFGLLDDVRECRLAVVLHRSPVFEGRLPEVLGRRSALPVLEPEDGAVWQPGRIYVAPRDQHMLADIDGVLRLSRGPRQHHSRPAVDPLFVSVARAWGCRAVGVILTGMGDDGASGLIAISQAGGVTLVQNPDEAPHPSMPRNAIRRDHVAASVVVAEMSGILAALAEGRPVAVGAPAPA